jgi:hypothetical protein
MTLTLDLTRARNGDVTSGSYILAVYHGGSLLQTFLHYLDRDDRISPHLSRQLHFVWILISL